MTFFSRLESRIQAVNSLLCVGLDPHAQDLSELSGEGAKHFCLEIIEETADVAAAYKPNAAFFEALGAEGVAALGEVIAAIPDEIPVILDAKRGDIFSTAQAYAHAVFQTLGADAVTINPYLGRDAVEPFIADPEKGVFMLCKTSNPGAADLQDLEVMGDNPVPLHVHVARLAQTWNTRDNLGLVVGATQPASLARVRAAAPDVWILAPGVGAQGGDLRAALQAGLRSDGLGMLIPVSRGISRADDPRQAALDLREAINAERGAVNARIATGNSQFQIADALLEAGCVKFGTFTLKSGVESPIYIDLRRLAGYPRLLALVAGAYAEILRGLDFDHLAALPYAAMPIATAISLRGNWPMIYPRKESKAYGTKAQVEGVFKSGERAVIIDDLISTGGSKFEGIEKLVTNGLRVKDVVVLIDRSPDGGAELSARGYSLHAVLTLPELLNHYEQMEKISPEKIAETREFLGVELV
ncbi:MAG: orotate phosphoribosyltransferase [Chloroflexota bacterium]|nr:MAG: orotate phosphoribosyltransferase [Chloroflexota bacterium]